MGEPGWESWTDSDSNRDDDDEELPSAEHEAAMASIGEFAHDEDLFHTQGLSYNPTNTTVASIPVSPLATISPPVTPEPAETLQALLNRPTDLDLLQIETDRELNQRRTELQQQAEQQLQLNQVHEDPASSSSDKETPLTESQLRILATLHGPEAERMATVFRHSNKHGLVKTLQKYDTRQHPTDQTQDAHAPEPSHPMSALQKPTVGLPSTLSAQDILDGLSVSKAESMARVLRHVNKE